MHKALVALGALVLLTAGCATTVSTEPAHQPGLSLAAPGCPTSLPGGKVRFPSAPSTTMTPANPDVGSVCRYGGLNDKPAFGLLKSANLDPRAATTLATDLNQGQVWPKGVAYSCPADFGDYDLVVFEYDNGVKVDVLVSMTGCESASNGTRTTMLPESARTRLIALVGFSTVHA